MVNTKVTIKYLPRGFTTSLGGFIVTVGGFIVTVGAGGGGCVVLGIGLSLHSFPVQHIDRQELNKRALLLL